MGVEPLILAVDDEPGVLRLLRLELAEQGFRVITAPTGALALQMAEEQRPDLVLLDITMPEMNGLEVMRRLRERAKIPVLLVTARQGDADKVRGLEMGADDYIVKPFSADELGARVRAVLRRSGGGPTAASVVRAGDLEVDLHRRLVTRAGDPVSLTRTEWLLLSHLAANAGRVMLNSEVLTRVWGPEYRDDVQYLRVWISRLRQKIERQPSSPSIIRTQPGIGYMFHADDPGEPAVAGHDVS